MNVITIILIAIGLATDAFAASITSGTAIKKLKINNAFKIAVFFGAFQAFMPIIGWLAGISLRSFISGVDHWIAFILLSFIGCKMILIPGKKKDNPLDIYILLILSIATSIDALAVGVSFAFLKISIATPVIVIGVITFSLSFLGVFIGNKVGRFFGNKLEIIGGVILIGIGVKILVGHLYFH